MSLSFRYFIESTGLFSLRESEAAPSMNSSPPVPNNPDKSDSKTNSHHWDSLKRQFGIDDKAFDAVITQGILDIWRVPDYSEKWGFLVNGTCSARVEKLPSDSYKVTFMLKVKKAQRPFDFFLPYNQGSNGKLNYYDGPVEDKTEIMSREELQDAMAEPWRKSGSAPQMGQSGPPVGGPGGMPPIGGPMGGI